MLHQFCVVVTHKGSEIARTKKYRERNRIVLSEHESACHFIFIFLLFALPMISLYSHIPARRQQQPHEQYTNDGENVNFWGDNASLETDKAHKWRSAEQQQHLRNIRNGFVPINKMSY